MTAETDRSEATLGERRKASSPSQLLEAVLDHLPIAVAVSQANGEIEFANAAARRILSGRHEDLLVARALREELAKFDFNATRERVMELFGPPRRTIQLRLSTLIAGEQPRAMAIIEDISERVRLDAIRRDFVANVSHELKTPVAALGLLAEAIAESQELTEAKGLAQRIIDEAFRLNRIIEDLLDLSRIEGGLGGSVVPLSLKDVVEEALSRISSAREARKIRLEMEESASEARVLGDRHQLVSAVYNLLDNAVKYSHEGSSVQLGWKRREGYWQLWIKDQGIGIPAADLERIFERFYRVDQARSRATGGTGLGLAIVRHVATNHGGSVSVDSREGEGSTFYLELPALEET